MTEEDPSVIKLSLPPEPDDPLSRFKEVYLHLYVRGISDIDGVHSSHVFRLVLWLRKRVRHRPSLSLDDLSRVHRT